MSEESIKYSKDGAIATITLNRPTKYNTLRFEMLDRLDDARFGTPYARVWGCHLTGMWVYRLGLAKAKYYALTGEWVSGREAAEIGLPSL